MTDYKKQGKANKAAGARFELKVRKDLEDKGWIVSKWMNNVVLPLGNITKPGSGMPAIIVQGYLIPAKHKFRGKGIPMAIGTGFPDFIAYKRKRTYIKLPKGTEPQEMKHVQKCWEEAIKQDKSVIIMDERINVELDCEVIGVEVKSNGYLTKEEKEKCNWLLDNDKFSKILIAKKGKMR